MFILNGKNEDKTFSRKTVTIYQIEIFEYKNLNKYKVFNVKIVNNDIKEEAKPGTVIKVSKNELVISTKDGGVSILEIQPPNSKRMDIVSFLNGNKICEGETFNV